MSPHTVVHNTVVVERRYAAAPAKVFAAWADVEQRRRWHFPGTGWVLAEMTQDFCVGGHERTRFGPKGAPNLMDEGRFLDIVPDQRIVSAGTMHMDGVRISTTLCTVELAEDAAGHTLVKLTDQSAFFDGREKPEERREGWGKIFERLHLFLSEHQGAKGASP